MIEHLVNWVVQFIGAAGYLGIFLLMLLESFGLPIPSEVIMPFSGFLVASGKLAFWPVVLLGAFGNLAGSLAAYWIGRRGGRPLIERYGKYILISRHDLDVADRWFARRGDFAAFFGRLLPVVRTYISFPAGIAKMNVKRFTLYSFLGALPWCALFAWLGIQLGGNWEILRQKFHSLDVFILGFLAAGIILYVYRHLRHRHHRI